MSISESDVKLLWGRAAAHCSRCRDDLTVKMMQSGHYNIGEMAHVIGRKLGAPRAVESSGPDTYDNLILLCPTCHTHIDKSPEGTYSKEEILEWKRQHEEFIANAFNEKRLANFEELKEEVSILLFENHKLFKKYGPHSDAAKDPGSNVHELWFLKKMSVMIPNNKKVVNVIEKNINLLTLKQRRLFVVFKDHASSWESYQYMKCDEYTLFPEDFGKEFNYDN
ncbi:HNH endonuclease [Rahnella perminowiae]|uniref:HNH endonuclease n=1 Tax=Rahnella perminowiae TaxID=2816244 RepID=UPI00300F1C6A